jgi:small conductance mechanosensitive channel
MTLALVAAFAAGDSRALAQIPITLPVASAEPVAGRVTQHGDLLTAPVRLDGALLFRVASLVYPTPGQIPADERATLVETALEQLTAIDSSTRETIYDPKTLRIDVQTRGNDRLLQAFDKRHHTALPIVTVTTIDSRFYQDPVPVVAAQWQAALETGLRNALEQRQPEAVRQNVTSVVILGVTLAAITVLLVLIRLRMNGLIERLEADKTAAGRARNRQRIAVLRVLRAALVWGLTLAWIAFLLWASYRFPQTTPTARKFVRVTLAIIVIWVFAIVVDRLLDLAIKRLFTHVRPRLQPMTSAERARERIRVPTAIAAVTGFKTFAVMTIAAFATFTQLGIQVTTVVTFGGLAAIAVSFAAQNLLRDFLSGVLVILEDQYAVGDFVTINGTNSGIVEAMTLRMLQLRDREGSLITLGHGTVTSVTNRSRNWSRVDFRLAVDANANISRAIEVIRQAVSDLAGEPAWAGMLVSPAEHIGVDVIGRDGIVLRALVKTAPIRQFEIGRELNLRVLARMHEAGIKPGVMPANLPQL